MKTKRIYSNGYIFTNLESKNILQNLFDDIDFYKKYINIISKSIKYINSAELQSKNYSNKVELLEQKYIELLNKYMIIYGKVWSETLEKDLFNILLTDLRFKFLALKY